MDQTPNEKLIGNSDGAAIVEAQKRAAGTYKPRSDWGTVTPSSPQKSTVNPIKGG